MNSIKRYEALFCWKGLLPAQKPAAMHLLTAALSVFKKLMPFFHIMQHDEMLASCLYWGQWFSWLLKFALLYSATCLSSRGEIMNFNIIMNSHYHVKSNRTIEIIYGFYCKFSEILQWHNIRWFYWNKFSDLRRFTRIQQSL